MLKMYPNIDVRRFDLENRFHICCVCYKTFFEVDCDDYAICEWEGCKREMCFPSCVDESYEDFYCQIHKNPTLFDIMLDVLKDDYIDVSN